MAVFGGRSGWVRAVAQGATFGSIVVLVAAGCGSRTSMLDPSLYESDADGVSGSGGAGGSSASNVAGAKPVAGSTSNGNVLDPSLAVAPCASYCPGYSTQCAELLNPGQDCMASCQAELNGSGMSCQRQGIDALNCLKPFFSPQGGSCKDAVARGLAQCGKLVNQFQACKKAAGNNSNSPQTMPTPAFDPTTCPADEQVQQNNCLAIYQCQSGPYVVTCNAPSSSGPQASCQCVAPNTLHDVTVPAVANPCQLAAKTCF
jgi:hypothetical protein